MPSSKGAFDATKDNNVLVESKVNHLLVIGIDAYEHCPTLFNCTKDAKEFSGVLKERFLFEEKNITSLFNKEATKKNIYQKFRELIAKLTPKDNLIIYFSGHGEFDKVFNQGYWIPVDAHVGAHSEYIPNSEIKTILSALKSHHVFLLSDSCFSGALFAKGVSKHISNRIEIDPSRWGLTAGRNEIVSDGQPGDNSPFAQSLLYRLKTTSKSLGVQELCAHVTEYVEANSTQTPIGEPLKVDGHKNGQFVFHLKNNPTLDWKKAQTANTVQGYLAFIKKYPAHEYNAPAKASASDLLWQEIQNRPDRTVVEIAQKLKGVSQYSDLFTSQKHYSQSLALGEYLEYKRDFLNAKSSEFKLKIFLTRPVPNYPKATEINSFAKSTLATLKKPIIAVVNNPSTPKEEPPIQIIQSNSKTHQEHTKVKEQPSTSSIKYVLIALGAIGFLFGIWKVMQPDGTTTSEQNTPTVIFKTIDTIQEKKPDPIPPNRRDVKPTPIVENKKTTATIPPKNPFMISIKGGKFLMGSNEGERDETPAGMVQVSDFLISKYEVSVKEFKYFIQNSGYRTSAETKNAVRIFDGKWKTKVPNVNWSYDGQGKNPAKSDHPVVFVSWIDAINYCNWRSKQENFTPCYSISNNQVRCDWKANGYRLPTESEWEYAARSSGKKYKYAGTSKEAKITKYINFCDANCPLPNKNQDYKDTYALTSPTRSLNPTSDRVYNMSGNVKEWCWNEYVSSYTDINHRQSQTMQSTRHSIRGGAWSVNFDQCTTTARSNYDGDEAIFDVGFRICRSK